MAIDISVGREIRIGVKEQSVWGTAEASNAVFEIIKCDIPDIKPDVKVLPDKTGRGSRYEDTSGIIVHEKGAMPKFSLSGIQVRKDDLAHFLYAFFQNVTEGAATPFSKSFIFSAAGQVDFTNSEGYYITVAQDNPAATDDYVLGDCICEGLHFSVAAGGESNILTLSADMVSRGAGAWTEALSGTWTLKDADHFYLEDITAFTFNHASAVSPVLKSLNIDLTQKVFPVGQDSGDFQTYGLDEFGGSLKASLFWEGATADLLGYWQAGTPGEYIVTFGTVDTDGYLAFTLYGVIETQAIAVEDGMLTNITLKLAGNTGSTKIPATVVLCDAQDKTW